MTVLIIGIHALVCLLLIVMILIQAGRGGGLVEGFSGVESMFGPKTNTFLTRTTTILSIVFFLTCLSLALISARQSRSLMRSVKPSEPVKQPSPSATENQAQPLQEVKPAQAQENSPTQQAAPAAEKQPQQAPAAEEKTSPK